MFAKFRASRFKISQVIFFFITFQILDLEIEQQGISLVNFEKTSTKLLKSVLSYIHCCNFFYFYCIMFYSVYLLSEKKGSATWIVIHDYLFLPNLHISKKFHVPAKFKMTSSKNLITLQGIYFHYSNQIVLKVPWAKCHASGCSQAKVKIVGHSSKNEVRKAHLE